MTAACGGLLWKRGADTTFGFQTKPKKTQTKIITVGVGWGGGGFNQPEPETGRFNLIRATALLAPGTPALLAAPEGLSRHIPGAGSLVLGVGGGGGTCTQEPVRLVETCRRSGSGGTLKHARINDSMESRGET